MINLIKIEKINEKSLKLNPQNKLLSPINFLKKIHNIYIFFFIKQKLF